MILRTAAHLKGAVRFDWPEGLTFELSTPLAGLTMPEDLGLA